MIKLKLKNWAALLIFSLLISAWIPCEAVSFENSEILKRGDAESIIITASDDYNKSAVPKQIMIGDENGNLNAEDPVTRIEALAMISRAFGDLPEPAGNNKRLFPQNVAYNDIPQWAADCINNLSNAGVILPSDDKLLRSSDNATEDWIMSVIRRIWSLLGSNLRDDFYANVNKPALDFSIISPGSTSSGTFSHLTNLNNSRIIEDIREISSKDWNSGSSEQKIKNFYLNSVNMEMRNKQGLDPIRKYLNEIERSNNIADLTQTRKKILDETGNSLLFAVNITVDPDNSSKYSLILSNAGPNMPAELYKSLENSNAYIAYIKNLLILTGSKKDQADKEAQLYYNFEKDLSSSMLKVWEYSDISKTNNKLTVGEISSILPSVDIYRLISNSGFKPEGSIIITDTNLFKKFASYMTDDNIELLKLSCRIDMALSFGSTLSDSFSEAKEEFTQKYYGIDGNKTADEKSLAMFQTYMPAYIGKIFTEKYFSPKAKTDVENIVSKLISSYKERINKLDWMSSTTKEKAMLKLDHMAVKVGYPNSWVHSSDNAVIRSYDEGGSLFENVCSMIKEENKKTASMQFEKVDRNSWSMGVYAVNAYYNPAANEIVFPAGILQPPFYDVNAPTEENMGGIGFIIAHEITHSFDNNGAKFDENGNAVDWWEKNDYIKFSELCLKAENFFDGIESAPGITNNGKLTLSENIADLGSMACILDTLDKNNTDYDKVFKKLAECWELSCTSDYLKYLSDNDVHSFAKIRVNRIIVNFNEFYDTYEIKPGDGMYVKPDDRISIW